MLASALNSAPPPVTISACAVSPPYSVNSALPVLSLSALAMVRVSESFSATTTLAATDSAPAFTPVTLALAVGAW